MHYVVDLAEAIVWRQADSPPQSAPGTTAPTRGWSLVDGGTDVLMPDRRVVTTATTTVNGTVATATAAGLQAALNQTTRVLAAVGAAVAAGLSARVALHTTINAVVGAAAADGRFASVSSGNGVAGSVGNATAAGMTATIVSTTRVVASVGVATATGLRTQVALHTTVGGSVADGIADGSDAAISQTSRVGAIVGVALGTGVVCAITVTEESGGNCPTVDQIAAAVWQRVLESGLTAEQMIRIMMAPLAGKATGIGTSTEVYYGQDGVTPRVTATFDEVGNRETVVADGS